MSESLTAERLAELSALIHSPEHLQKLRRSFMHITSADIRMTLVSELTTSVTQSCGEITITIPSGHKIAVCYIEAFTKNCGIRAVRGLEVRHDVLSFPFWIHVIEEIVKAHGFSCLLASDGQHGYIAANIAKCPGWYETQTGWNERMKHNYVIYSKQLMTRTDAPSPA